MRRGLGDDSWLDRSGPRRLSIGAHAFLLNFELLVMLTECSADLKDPWLLGGDSSMVRSM